jgi:hypothetical protein
MKYQTLKILKMRSLIKKRRNRAIRLMGWVVLGLVICIIFASLIGCVGFNG